MSECYALPTTFNANAVSQVATEVHGFVTDRAGGPLTRIDVPGAPATVASGIDDRGRIAGLYLNPNAAPGAASGSPPATSPAWR